VKTLRCCASLAAIRRRGRLRVVRCKRRRLRPGTRRGTQSRAPPELRDRAARVERPFGNVIVKSSAVDGVWPTPEMICDIVVRCSCSLKSARLKYLTTCLRTAWRRSPRCKTPPRGSPRRPRGAPVPDRDRSEAHRPASASRGDRVVDQKTRGDCAHRDRSATASTQRKKPARSKPLLSSVSHRRTHAPMDSSL